MVTKRRQSDIEEMTHPVCARGEILLVLIASYGMLRRLPHSVLCHVESHASSRNLDAMMGRA